MKVAWTVAMSTAAYGVEALWEGQWWLLGDFDKLTRANGRVVAGTLRTTKGEDAIRAGDITPTEPALDRRRERLLIATLAAPGGSPKRALLLPHPEDDSSKHHIPKWFAAATGNGSLIRERQEVGGITPARRLRTHWAGQPPTPEATCHVGTDGSYRASAGLEWLITRDDVGTGPGITQGSKTLGNRQTAFDAEVAAIETAVDWHRRSDLRHCIIHSDSTSANARMCHSGAGPGQGRATNIRRMIGDLLIHEKRLEELHWVKAHIGIPGNERADKLAGAAAEKTKPSTASLSYLKL